METKYERSWDRYSQEWEKQKESGTHLGVEWGDRALTERVFEQLLKPNLAKDFEVLEIGPGGGKYSFLVAPLVKRLICADVSQKMLDRTRERLREHAHVETKKFNGLDFSGLQDASLDLVFSIDVFVHLDLEDIYCYLREIRRVLKPGCKTVLHFANILTVQGWLLLMREADINRADHKQIGRISFMTPEVIRKLCKELKLEILVLDEEISPRDFLVVLQKPSLPAEASQSARTQRILRRAGGGTIVRDMLHELPGAQIAAPTPEYVTSIELDIGGDKRDLLFQHPPSLVGFTLTVPPKAKFRSAIAVDPRVHEKCSPTGITFKVLLRVGSEEHELISKRLDPRNKPADRAWQEVEADLAPFVGRHALLILETGIDQNPNDFNWCGWGEPAILVR